MDTSKHIPWDDNEKRAFMNVSKDLTNKIDPEILIAFLVDHIDSLTPQKRAKYLSFASTREMYEEYKRTHG
jgi:hypothetical protein